MFSVILMLGVYLTHRYNPLQAKSLFGALLANTFLNVFEALAYIFRGNASDLGWWMVRISNFAVFLCNHLVLLFAAAFIVRTLERSETVISPMFKRAYNAAIFVGIALLALSRIFGFYYAFDEHNQYYRLNSYWLMVIILWGSMLALFALTLKHWRCFSRIERASFVTLEVMPIVTAIAQLFTYGISLTTFAGSTSLALMFIAYELECSREIVANERRMLDDVIGALAEAVDAKDTYTRGHSGRVAEYAKMLAKRLGLGREEAERIYRMALLHDVGKIGIPDAVLSKPGRLSKEEFGVISSHASLGGDILSKVETMPEFTVGARWHHERYDGHGYPDGISGDDIPLEARIICVADCYDAMTSDRVYRTHLSQDVVRKEIQENAGTQFDPDVARAMLEIMDEDKGYHLREHG